MLDSGSLVRDFVAKRVVSQLRLEHPIVTNKSRTVCSCLDSKCYDISDTLALYVFLISMNFYENVANLIILESSPIDLLIGRETIKKFDLFNQVPSRLEDVDEKPMTAVIKTL